jgi:hypothetical protein
MTTDETREITAWLGGRLPGDWTGRAPEITVDREEIVVRLRLDDTPTDSTAGGPAGPDAGSDAEAAERSAAAQGRLAGWREETRAARIQIAREAEHRFGRTVSWGARLGDESVLFTHLAVPVMTRLRQRQRLVLDTLVEAGVAKSRADAVQWCVRLVGEHADSWLAELRQAMGAVRTVRDRGPEL